MRVRRTHSTILLLLATLGMAAPAMAEAPSPVTTTEMLEFFGLDAGEIARMRAGEIVKKDMPQLEGTDTGLGIAFAMIVPHGVDDCSQQFAGTEMFQADPNLLAHGLIDPEDPSAALAAARFNASEAGEARLLVTAERGSEFNLSMDEYTRIAAAPGNSDELARANALLELILHDRFTAYLESGLDGVADYARTGRKRSTPAEELRVAWEKSPIVKSRFPEFHRHIGAFPGDPMDEVEDRFYWIKRTIEERPVWSLVHWSMLVEKEFAFLSERTYFAGHTYNASQVYFGVLPVREGVMVFYLNRTFTDKVDIFAKSLAHRIGRGKVAEPIRETFEVFKARIMHH